MDAEKIQARRARRMNKLYAKRGRVRSEAEGKYFTAKDAEGKEVKLFEVYKK